MSLADAARWHMATPANHMIIGAMLLFEERLPVDAFERLVRERLVLAQRRFRQHVVESPCPFGRPRWEDDVPFDVASHVSALGGDALDDAALARLAGQRMSAPFPRHLSPWSFEVAELQTGGSAVLFRVHHCVADGRALVSLLQSFGDGAAPARGEVPAAPPRGRARRRGAGLSGRLAGLLRFATLSRDPPSFLRPALQGDKCVAWSAPFSLARLEAMAQARGHHLTEVLLGAVGGALERHPRGSGQPLRSVRALVPVAEPLESTPGRLGNHFASVFVNVPVAAPDPAARVEAIAREMAALRARGDAQMATGLIGLAGALSPAVERRAAAWWSRRASLGASSLAGPPAPLRIAGAPLAGVVVWAPAAATIGLSLTFFGYAGSLRLGVVADAAVTDRPQQLVDAFAAALEDLEGGATRGAP